MSDFEQQGAKPSKYSTLKQAQEAGLNVPKSILLNAADLIENDIERFLSDSSSQLFIVRSANLAEDGSDFSLAGHFWSSEAVSKSDVNSTIQLAAVENGKILASLSLEHAPLLILQEYIEHTVGGVLFSPWGFYPDYAYVEYSESGVKSVVEGEDSHPAVLCIDEKQNDPLALPETLSHLKPLLSALCQQLRQLFPFPIDCEWAYDESQQCIVVLQVRPQTHLIGPVLPYSKLQQSKPAGNSSALDNGQWEFTALSESLGRLSPLSFSLLEQLYADATTTLQLLGCKAESVNFMHYAPDGSVLVDAKLEQQFFRMTLFGGFKRGLQQTQLLTEALQVMSEYQTDNTFSYDTLQALFKYWLAANVLSNGAGRHQVSKDHAAIHAYELSWPTSLLEPITPDDRSWASINSWGRNLFLFELNKLKHDLAHDSKTHPYQTFLTWSEFTKQEHALGEQRQHTQALGAFYDHALISDNDTNETHALSTTKPVQGQLLIITNPAQFTGNIAESCILVAPYFDNRWVSKIESLQGIIVNRGSRLSHSAIVAREHGIPYYVMSGLDLHTLSTGQQITLDAGKIEQ
ncbi:PEP-utilizing enzyme [Leucothrix arctica]|uniref:PEP-utilising enzyme mobile domain-containing protein n=1 Tax=Leucothrix arctica TaxID=1481894 RepID=A0A317CDU0_9GAMM|nr:PEP-utilizing enzyme [Leucothrix arctica]PWQ96824.1 hypothetical protein DKT75_08645 [Leucothrix arctica]